MCKKIAVLGPITSAEYFGGVATFTENIAKALKRRDYNVAIITKFSNEDKTLSNIQIIGTKIKLPILNWFFYIYKSIKYLYYFNPDAIISSLDYGIVHLLFKKPKKVYFLHGFPTKEYSLVRFSLILLITKIICKNSDFIVSNSSFTKTIVRDIFGIRSNFIINPAVSDEFIDTLKNYIKNNLQSEERGLNILYSGRLVKAKNVNKVIEALRKINLKYKGIKFLIVGDGPERKKVLKILDDARISFEYFGRVTQFDLVKIYLKSRVFISLNPHEPFGITYLESLLAGCNVVCPITGGHVDFSLKFSERFFFVRDIDDINELEENITKALIKWKPFNYDSEIVKAFCYQSISKILINRINL